MQKKSSKIAEARKKREAKPWWLDEDDQDKKLGSGQTQDVAAQYNVFMIQFCIPRQGYNTIHQFVNNPSIVIYNHSSSCSGVDCLKHVNNNKRNVQQPAYADSLVFFQV